MASDEATIAKPMSALVILDLAISNLLSSSAAVIQFQPLKMRNTNVAIPAKTSAIGIVLEMI